MEKQNRFYHQYQDGSLPHKVNVFHIHTQYRFFHISCDNCKLKEKCEPIRHKREICDVATDTRELLAQHTVGHVSSFVSDDFYIITQKKNRVQKNAFKTAVHEIWLKYAKETDAR